MNSRWLQRQARVLLSWREQALRAAAGQLDEPHGLSPDAALTQARTAQARLESLRATAHKHVDHLSVRLQRLVDQQTAIANALQSGSLPPARANRKHHRLNARMTALRAEIAACRHAIAADTSEAVGGLLEAPLGRYCRLSRQPSYFRWSTMDRVDRWTLTATAVLVFVLVFGIGMYLRKESSVHFETFIAERGTATLVLRCVNETPQPIVVGLGDVPGQRQQYVVRVQVSADGGYQTLDGIAQALVDDVARMENPGAMTVAPGLFQDYKLALRAAVPADVPLDTVRIECLGPDGNVAYRHTVSF